MRETVGNPNGELNPGPYIHFEYLLIIVWHLDSRLPSITFVSNYGWLLNVLRANILEYNYTAK